MQVADRCRPPRRLASADRTPCPDGHDREHGFVLVGVVWSLLLLALLALPLISIGRESRLIVRNEELRVETRLRAEAGIAVAIAVLVNSQGRLPFRINGTPQASPVPGGEVQLSVWDDAGRVNINSASYGTLTALLEMAGVPQGNAAAIADEIVRWRTPQPGGAAVEASAADGVTGQRATRPRHRSYEAIDDLRLIPGMTAAVLELIRPAITVFSSLSSVDRTVASRFVRSVLAAEGAQAAGTGDQNEDADSRPQTTTGRVFTIQAEASTRTMARVVLEATIRVTPDPRSPFWILAYKELTADSLPDVLP